ncbi:LacI family DNA-binding transcriptional regulator [Streptomyces chartreusis]|uniref:LacI family DNA-binding transcriptional regulator n=1 Tax=Streptomyces chartreusis TaxID=1969 RepID=UPI00364B656C
MLARVKPVSTRQPDDASTNGTPSGLRRRPTINDVARLADVSTATVSRVLSGVAKVSPEKHAQVLRAIEQLDYNPSDLTRAVFNGRSNAVGVLVADMRNPYYVDLVRGVESVITEGGGLVFLANGHRDRERQEAILRAMDAQRLRGLVITANRDIDEGAVRRLADRGAEIVFVTRPAGISHPRIHSVRVDDEAVGALAWQHLRDRGRRNVAVVTQPLDTPTQRARLRGIRDAARLDGVDLADDRVVELQSLDEPALGLEEVLKACGSTKRGAVDAVFAATGIGTLRAYQELMALGVRVPDDVAFVGFDDFLWAPYLASPLTVVTQPTLAMGTQAARLIIDEPGAAVEHVLAPGLTVRAST